MRCLSIPNAARLYAGGGSAINTKMLDSTRHTSQYYVDLIHELRASPNETEWLEFKVNNVRPEMIGRSISALSNAAALIGKPRAYMIWGINDANHDIVGADFVLASQKVGNEQLENWLLRSLNPSIDFRFHEIGVDGKSVVILEIDYASQRPIAFKNEEFIRVGSLTKKLREYPEKERALWRVFDRVWFEQGIAAEHLDSDSVLSMLDYPSYFELLEMPIPDGRNAVLDALQSDRLITRSEAGGWSITNLGAILFAKNIGEFPHIRRKAMRVIQYKGSGRFETLREQSGVKGYAVGFSGLIDYIMTLLPSNEIIEQSLRKTMPMFPELAIRELVANALIHQDFLVTGAGPMVEIFDDRIEITNPGNPLVDTDRFVDSPPKSRNEDLAALMRRFRICEERGSGIDKVVLQVELFQLPAPLFDATGESTRVTMFAHKSLSDMDKIERVRSCYIHACLRYVTGQPINNTSIRERFGILERNAATASKILTETIEAGQIIIRDPAAGYRNRAYLPYWAG